MHRSLTYCFERTKKNENRSEGHGLAKDVNADWEIGWHDNSQWNGHTRSPSFQSFLCQHSTSLFTEVSTLSCHISYIWLVDMTTAGGTVTLAFHRFHHSTSSFHTLLSTLPWHSTPLFHIFSAIIKLIGFFFVIQLHRSIGFYSSIAFYYIVS